MRGSGGYACRERGDGPQAWKGIRAQQDRLRAIDIKTDKFQEKHSSNIDIKTKPCCLLSRLRIKRLWLLEGT